MRQLRFVEAVNEALAIAMQRDPRVLCFGLGVTDPKSIFETTAGLEARFGSERVFDMPTSENAMTGVALGAALCGYRPVMVHQRLDFFLLAMDQLVNGAAKWHYVFGGQDRVPLTIRLVLGRGWGQGPTHSQNLQAWFAHVPGLKVVMPASPRDARDLLLESIFDDDPVVFLEHRWLHNQQGPVPETPAPCPIGQARLVEEGDDCSIVAFSYMTVEAIHAVAYLREHGIHCDLIDLRTVSPLDWESVERSLRKTGRLVVLDTGAAQCSVASEIVARAAMRCHDALRAAPVALTSPDCPVPTSFGLTHLFYKRAVDIVRAVGHCMGREVPLGRLIADQANAPHDVPGDWFRGPF